MALLGNWVPDCDDDKDDEGDACESEMMNMVMMLMSIDDAGAEVSE